MQACKTRGSARARGLSGCARGICKVAGKQQLLEVRVRGAVQLPRANIGCVRAPNSSNFIKVIIAPYAILKAIVEGVDCVFI